MKVLEEIKRGLSISLGIFIFFGILFSIYAFVEPTQGPNAGNNYINKLNPFSKDIGSLSANIGMYNNKILDRTFPLAYTEVCFKNGATYNDTHAGTNQATSGGNCLPGDTGYVIEKTTRTSSYWEASKAKCLQNDMRIPESFEYEYSCRNRASLGLTGMGVWEWSSNTALPMSNGANYGVGVPLMGGGGCNFAAWYWVGSTTGASVSSAFRCSR